MKFILVSLIALALSPVSNATINQVGFVLDIAGYNKVECLQELQDREGFFVRLPDIEPPYALFVGLGVGGDAYRMFQIDTLGDVNELVRMERNGSGFGVYLFSGEPRFRTEAIIESGPLQGVVVVLREQQIPVTQNNRQGVGLQTPQPSYLAAAGIATAAGVAAVQCSSFLKRRQDMH